MSDRKPKPAPDAATIPKGERIARRLARAGLCSRREAERWIEAGRVSVDGKKLDTPAFTVTAASRILVDDKPLPAAEPAALWRYYKPGGLVTTNRDPQGRPTIFDRLPGDLPRVMTVGRLDLTTEGLLLLTNDGALARHLELPSTGWTRRYRVRVHGAPDPDALKALGDGITISGIHYGPITARLDRQQGSNAWLTFVIREGKNREVRRVCEHLGLTVNRLIRVGYGPFELGDLAPGAVARVPARILRDQLGKALPEVDFGTTEKPGAGGKGDRPAAKGRPPEKDRRGPRRPAGGKRPFGDRPPRGKDAAGADERTADRPGAVRGKGPARKPFGAQRSDSGGADAPRRGSGGQPARRGHGDDAPTERDDPRSRPEGHTAAAKGPHKPGRKAGLGKAGDTKRTGGKPPGGKPPGGKPPGGKPNAGAGGGARGPQASSRSPASEKGTPAAAARPSTGASRGSARRRKTLDANRRRSS